MGTYNLAAPPRGILFLLLVYTAVLVSTLMAIPRRLRDSHVPATGSGSVCRFKQARVDEELECSICLTGFEPGCEKTHLCCGHVFHKVCLDKWNLTCPLCRNSFAPS